MINWKEQSEGDFIAIEGDYMLRVEQLDKHYYWWCTYFKDDQIATEYDGNEASAKKYAERAMNKHKME